MKTAHAGGIHATLRLDDLRRRGSEAGSEGGRKCGAGEELRFHDECWRSQSEGLFKAGLLLLLPHHLHQITDLLAGLEDSFCSGEFVGLGEPEGLCLE